jgi:uncharacterized protein YozE (UPF0346 family)
MTQCWAAKAENRPTFSDVVSALSQYLEHHSDYTVLTKEQDEVTEAEDR